MDAGYVDADARLFHRRYFAAVPCATSLDEYVSLRLSSKVSPHLDIAFVVWPANLVTCALFNTLHAKTYAGMGTYSGISRERFFLYVLVGSMCWYFLPGYLFQALSYFSWVCWIAPNNIVVNQLFGYMNGLGMSLVTFDWAQITFIGAQEVVPWDRSILLKERIDRE